MNENEPNENERERHEDDTENEEEHDMDSSLRPTSFCLNGKLWTFENPVSLVLAAARQLGMAVQRDARLLWIADEALLDEFDEEQALVRVRPRARVRVRVRVRSGSRSRSR